MINFNNIKIKLSGIKTIILCLLFLNLLSISCIFSSLHQGGEFIGKSLLIKQIIWISISWIFLIFFSLVNYRIYYNFSYIIYFANIMLLLGVLTFGKTMMGAQRWISFLGFTFQPSELSKVAIIILLAHIFSLK